MRYTGELARKAIHFSSLAIPIGLYLTPPEVSKPVLLILALTTLAVDVVRLHAPQVRTIFYFLFGRIIREHERFNLLGSTYLLLAALLCLFAFEKPIAVTSLGFLVVGDTMAALVGRRWGRIKILEKSLEGSLACFGSCVLVGWLYPGPELSWTMILVGSAVATIFELLPIPLDDNLRMSLSAGFAMTWVRGLGG
jgi:dolichol kinase